jgi:hypothetical protein
MLAAPRRGADEKYPNQRRIDDLKQRIIMFVLLACLFTTGFLTVSPVRAAPGDDYFVYSSYDPEWFTIWGISGVGGYVADYGDPDIWGDEEQYLYFLDDVIGHKVKVWLKNYEDTYPGGGDTSPTWIDPHQHPDNPDATGPIEPRHFEWISSADLSPYIGGSIQHTEEFHVDDRGIFLGAWPNGIHKWDHNWNYIGQIANPPDVIPHGPEPWRTESLAYNPDDNIWYAGGRDYAEPERNVYQLADTDNDDDFMDETWEVIFAYPALGDASNEHHDGMDYANGFLWISDMFSDILAQWYYDEVFGVWVELNRFTYTEANVVEGMGFGPNDHLWVSRSYYRRLPDGTLIPEPETSHLYELGGGALQQQEPIHHVYLDIKPGSWPNTLNLISNGVLPVAICGTEEFDVTTIDPATITITHPDTYDEVAPLRWSYEDVATPFTGEVGGGHELTGDGFTDLVFYFDIQEVKNFLGLADYSFETIPLIITGNLCDEYDGTHIRGGDFVRILAYEEEVQPHSRGHYYAPPFPDYNAPHVIKTGTWVTIGFTLLADGNTPEEAEELLHFIVDNSWTVMTINDNPIPFAHTYFRWYTFFIEFDPVTDTYTAYVRYRYYLPPQSPGDYEIYWQFYYPLNGQIFEATGTITWVEGQT